MVGDALVGTASGISMDPWHRGDPWHGLVWPLTPRALKCFTKAALAAPALSLWGKKEKEKEEREKEPKVNRAGSLMEAAPAAEGPS